MATRVTQLAVETLKSGEPNARVTQLAVETLKSGTPNARVTQLAIEVLRSRTELIELALLDQTAVAYGPTVTQDGGAQSIQLALIDQTAVLFDPTIEQNQVVQIELLEQTATAFSPTVTTASAVSLALIDQTGALFDLTVSAGGISLDFINQAAALFAPTVTTGAVTVSVNLIDQTATAFTPTITPGAVTVSVALIDQTAVAYEPTVAVGGISFALINQTAVAFAPSVSPLSVVLDRIDQTSVAYQPTVFAFVVAGAPSTIVIRYNGTDITDDVILKDCEFESKVNGAVGTANLRVKDINHTYEFISGGSLTLDINSVRVWGGYVRQALKVYAFSAEDTTDTMAVTRMWEIAGVDYNVLFLTRVVFKESDPTGKIDFSYSTNTYDDTIINDLFDNYLDIGGDGLSRSGVTRIDKTILDLPGANHRGNVVSAGSSWQAAMNNIQRASGGVYYISPSKVLTYVDVETANSSYTLTDQPSGAFDIGYQSFTILEDGTKLINDMFLWGASTGTPEMAFTRVTDAASLAEHDRWQYGLTASLFRPASMSLVANSYVYGTPQSHRGGKDDAVTFSCTVFEPVFEAGQVVNIECATFGFAETYPIRKIKTTFPSPDRAVFELTLSHDIDQALGFAEFLWPRALGPGPGPGGPPPPPPPPPPPESGECDDAVCLQSLTFDDFNRTTSPVGGSFWTETEGWGFPSYGGGYWSASSAGSDVAAYCNGSQAVIPYDFSVSPEANSLSAFPLDESLVTRPWANSFELTAIVEYDTALPGPVGNYEGTYFQFACNGAPSGNTRFVQLYIGNEVDDPPLLIMRTSDSIASVSVEVDTPPINTPIYIKFQYNQGATSYAKVWWGSDPEPGWMLSQSGGLVVLGEDVDFRVNTATSYEHTAYINNIDFVENLCESVQFEDFNRTVVSGYGETSGQGGAWTDSGTGTFGVNGAQAYVTNGARTAWVPGALWDLDPFTLTARVQVGAASSAGRVSFAISNGDNLSEYARVSLDGSGLFLVDDNIDFNESFGDFASLGTSSWYLLKWQLDGAMHRAKYWLEGTTEPDWIVETTLPNLSTRTYLIMVLVGSGSGVTTRIDYLELTEYEGRPCVSEACGTFITDTFTRDVDPGWGMSASGHVWSPTIGSYDTDRMYTYDGIGELNFNLANSSLGQQFSTLFTETIDTTVEWMATLDDSDLITLGGPINQMIVAAITFSRSTIPAQGIGVAAEWRLGSGISPTPIPQLQFYRQETAVLEHVASPIDFVANTWYKLRFRAVPGDVLRAKVWERGDTEPGSWVESTTTAPSDVSYESFSLSAKSQSGTNLQMFVDYDNLSISASCVPLFAGPGLPVTGYVCEELSGNNGVYYSLSRTFAALSTEVWVNGLRQIRLTHFLEIAPSTIGFTEVVPVGSIIRVCYTATGPA